MKKRRGRSVQNDTYRLAQQLTAATACHRNGEDLRAQRILERLHAEHPNNPALLDTYGLFLKDRDRFSDAIGMLQRAVQLSPGVATYWAHLGAVCQDDGSLDAAFQAYRQAIALDPARWDVYVNLAHLDESQGSCVEAAALYRLSIEHRRDYAPAWGGLARVCTRLGQLEDSVSYFGEALSLDPTPELYCDLSLSLFMNNRLQEALAAAQKAVDLNPRFAMGHCRMGSALTQIRLIEGKRAFEAALAADPTCKEAMQGLGVAASRSCDWEEAIYWLVRAMELHPDCAAIHSTLLFTLSISNSATPGRVLEEHRNWAHMHASRVPAFRHTPDKKDPARRLRIGFVSGDFRDHPVRFFIAPILRGLDRSQFEVVCYSNTSRADAVTAQLRALADQWHEVFGQNDVALAEQIKNDGIDILVDLSGHTDGNRLLVFARKPAPVEVTYLGYMNTTGLASMDYWLTDWVLHPPDTRHETSERIWRLPRCWLIYEPPASAPAVARREDGSPVTFVSFNALRKLSSASLRLWARVLAALPDSRIYIKVQALDGDVERTFLLDRLASAGIPSERVALMSHRPSREEHLAWYGAVDIALDTTPFSGATTTAEALWMGVPVVTLPGDVMASRMSASMMHAADLDEFIAKDEDDYVRIATELAGNAAYRSQLRGELRARVAASPLCDGPGLANEIGAAFRQMWMAWCAPKQQEITP